MSKSVEKRIVEMRFDNQQFEKGVQTTMGTLDKLKHSLKLDGATKGLEDVDKAVKGINISGLSSAVETVKSRFSALEVVAITALANITNSVVNAGKKLVDSFTLEPIHQGFAEYELKMGSVQTIMASTGADIKTVNGYLEELNTYSDKTIYSFSDMTSSIGKFTNAGVSLDDAVKAIKGISNEAAVSGANANEASRAMYNFAQALSSGAVKLIDWKSIENANMATVEFKQSLLDTALAMGTVVKVGDKYQSTTTDAQGKISDLFTATSMFNDSLSSQWMTTDVLVQTLGNYATDVREMTAAEKKAYEEKLRGIGYTEEQIKAIEELGQKAFDSAQDVKTFSQLMDTLKEAAGSGWAQTFEILFGDLEEAKVLWTSVSQVVGGFIGQLSKARNDMLQGWKDLGGRQALIESVQNAFSGLMSVVKPVGEAFREIFPATTSEQLINLTKGLKEFTSHLKLSDKDSQNLKNTFKGLFAVLDLVKQGIGALVKAVFPMTKGLGSLGSGVLSVTGKIGEWLVSLDQAAKKSDVFNQTIQKFHDKVSPILKSVKGHIDGTVVAIKKFAETHFNVPDTSGLMSVADKLKARIEPFKKIGEVAKEAMGKLVDAFKASAPVLANLGGIIVDALGKVIDGIMKALRGEGFDSLIDLLNGGIVTGIGVGIMKFIKNLTGLESTADDAIGGFAGIIEGFKGAINGAKETLADFQASLKADILMKIAGSIAVLAGSLLVLSLIDSDKLGGALASISILFAELAASMALFDKTLSGQKGLNKFGMAMIEMSAAILVLASALKKIASIDSDKLAGALVGITVLIGEMVAASLALSKWGGKIKTSAVSMILFAEAINILANAVGKLGTLNTDKLTKGLDGVGVLMAELAAFMVASKFGNFKATQGLAIIELSAALLILEKSVSGFGSMPIKTIKKGLTGVGVILAEVAGFSVIAGKAKHILSSATALTVIGAAMLIFGKAIKDIGSLSIKTIGKGLIGIGGALAAVAVAVNLMPKNMVGIGLGLLEVAAALKIIGSVIQDAGGMKWEEIGKGMVVLAGSMTILAIALNAMKGTLGGASAMLVMSAALAVFTPVLKSLGSMSLAEIGKGLLALAGAFTVLGIAGAVLGPMVPAILGLSGALALLGVAVAACGVGILAFSAGLASLAVSGVAGVTALVAALEILIVGVLGIIANSATAIAGAVKAIILAIVDVIVECAPPIAEGVLTLIEEVLKSLAEHGPNIVTYLMDFLIGVINAIAARLPELIKAAVNLIGAFFKGVVDALKGIDTNVLLEGIVGIGLLSAIMLALSAVAGLIPGAMAGVLGMGVVIAEMALVLAAVGALAQLPGLKWLIGEGGDLLQGVGTAIGKFVGGIVGGFLGGISAQFPQIGQDLTDFMSNAQGFIEGAKKIDPAMLQGVNALAQTILLLTAANILDGLTKWFTGGTSLVKFGEELAEFGPYFKKYSDEIAGINPEVITASSNAALALAEMASKLPNSGGLAGKIFGENNLSDFGAELEKFGPHIKKYGDQVRGLDAGAVKASAEAAQLLADMAATLPNSGGLAALIMG
ncbi:tape measure protein, partial [Bacteroides caecimuris]|uniref:tape measure protein n=1 Tax=Bacteroides caecimuris TaxID=1796613 RepID=UPI00263AA561